MDLRIRFDDGPLWLHMTSHLARGVSGFVDTWVVTLVDIDDVVNERVARRKTEQLLATVTDHLDDLVYQSSRDGIVEWCSPSVSRLFGWRVEDIVGHSPLDFVHEEDRAYHLARRSSVWGGHSVDIPSTRWRCADGGVRVVSLHAEPVVNADGTVVGTTVTIRPREEEDALQRSIRTLQAGLRAITVAQTEVDVLDEICQLAVNSGGYLGAWYGRVRFDEESTLEVMASYPPGLPYFEDLEVHWSDDDLGRGSAGRAVRQAEAVSVMDITSDAGWGPWRERAERSGIHSTTSIPVTVFGRIDGVLTVLAGSSHVFSPEAVTILESLTVQLGLGLERLSR